MISKSFNYINTLPVKTINGLKKKCLEEFYIELGKTISDGKYYVVQITQSLTSNSFDDIVTYNVMADVAESPTKLTYIYQVDESPKEQKISFWKRLKYLFTGRF